MNASTGFATPAAAARGDFRLPSIAQAHAYAADYLGKRDRRKIGHNTYLCRAGDGFRVQFHATDIVRIGARSVVLDSGGYRTFATKERLNGLLPAGYRVMQDRGVWYLGVPRREQTIAWADGITIDARGGVHNAGSEKAATELRKAIHKYAARFAREAVAGKVPAPGAGDCWYCGMVVSEGPSKDKSLGEATGDVSHLQSHLEEGYLVPALLANAARERGNRYLLNWGLPILWGAMDDGARAARLEREGKIIEREIRCAVRQYLGAKLGLALR